MDSYPKGFTLIEMIIVLVVIGILAATAIPKFHDFGTEARISAVKGMYAAVSTGAMLTHSKAVVDALDLNNDNLTVNLDGKGGAERLAYGYPKSTHKHTMEWIVEDIGNFTYNPGLGQYVLQTDCYVQYQDATATTSPTITINTTGC